jgi:hypothetical protein
LWDTIKKAIQDISAAIDKEWKNIIKFLQDAGAALGPIVKFLQDTAGGISGAAKQAEQWKTPRIPGLLEMLGITSPPQEDDFISRPGMGIQSFSPSDTIIGTKGGMGGGVTVNNTFNIDAGVDSSKLKEILSKFAREQARELRMRTSYSAGVYS